MKSTLQIENDQMLAWAPGEIARLQEEISTATGTRRVWLQVELNQVQQFLSAAETQNAVFAQFPIGAKVRLHPIVGLRHDGNVYTVTDHRIGHDGQVEIRIGTLWALARALSVVSTAEAGEATEEVPA